MGLDMYLDLSKKEEYIDKRDLVKLDKIKQKIHKCCNRLDNLYAKRKLTFKSNFSVRKFYSNKITKHYREYNDEYLNTKNRIYKINHKWLNPDYRLDILFTKTVIKNHDYYSEYTDFNAEDEIEITIEDLKEVYTKYAELEDYDKQNLEMMKDIIDNYNETYCIKYSWWV